MARGKDADASATDQALAVFRALAVHDEPRSVMLTWTSPAGPWSIQVQPISGRQTVGGLRQLLDAVEGSGWKVELEANGVVRLTP